MKLKRKLIAVAAVGAVLLFVAPMVAASPKPTRAYYQLTAPEYLTVGCNDHLGEPTKGWPYELYCSGGPSPTTTTVPPTTTTSGSSNFVTASGTSLILNGSPVQFIGFDAYGTLGDWNGSNGMAWTNGQLDTYFASLPANGLSRLFAFPQDEMENSGSNDANTVTALENVLAQAAIYDQHVILVLGNDDGSANITESDPTGAGEPLSFYQPCSGGSYCYQTEYQMWVNTVVPAIMNNSTDAPLVAMWEIANEPGDFATVPEATMATYLNTAAGYIHSAAAGTLNPNVLVETGVDYAGAMGGGQTNYTNAQSGNNINVLSYHDYSWDYEGGLALDTNYTNAQNASISLDKPFITGEAGIEGCQTPSGDAENGLPFKTWAQRVTYDTNEATNYFAGTGPSGTNTAAKDSAVLFWDYVPVAGTGATTCGDYHYDISPPDPLVAAVTNFVTSGGGGTTTTTVPPTTTVPGNNQAPIAALLTQSIFNQNVTNAPVTSNSANLVSAFVNQVNASLVRAFLGVKGTWLNSQPTYYAAPGTPLVSVVSRCAGFVGNQPGQVPPKVPLPTYLSLNGSSDDPLVVYSPSLNLVYELWQAQYSNGTLSGCWGGGAPLSSFTGVFTGTYGMSATSIAYAATAITENDVASGSINHAVAVQLAYCNGVVAPAHRGDCGGQAGQPAEGQWFRFAPGTVCGSACNNAFANMVFRAISTYGLVVTDQTQGSTVALILEQGSDWTAEGHSGTDPITSALGGAQLYSVIAGFPWSQLQVIDPTNV